MSDPQAKTETQAQGTPAKPAPAFPDPSIMIVEFGDALGILLGARTERDAEHRRLVMKKVAYIRFTAEKWGASTCPEVWIEEKSGIFYAVEARSGQYFRTPSKRRYEVAFLTRDVFDCAVECLKNREPEPLLDLALVTFGARDGFGAQQGSLTAPEDYAAHAALPEGGEWVPYPSALG